MWNLGRLFTNILVAAVYVLNSTEHIFFHNGTIKFSLYEFPNFGNRICIPHMAARSVQIGKSSVYFVVFFF